jgi:hypothetical protein
VYFLAYFSAEKDIQIYIRKVQYGSLHACNICMYNVILWPFGEIQ